ncbi:MAG TPA: YidC/Oxa1 family membrane protein insertase [Tenericutes bacterium]|nr:YidC/Oxa1 family membrane protein insertase [Mycoplasmatota bacterium]
MKKKILIFLISFMILFTSGCTKILKDNNNKVVTNKTTGQNLVSNILCQPENKETRKLYEDNNIDLNKLEKCKDMSITAGEYEGIWTTVFVKPLAWLIVKIGNFLGNYGVSVIIVTILIRLLMYPFTKKAAMQSENLKKAKPELDNIEKKYKDKLSKEDNILKSQDMLMIYKKYNINPMSGCLFGIIQIPLFFAFYESLNRLPAIFEESLLGFQLGTTPLIALSKGNYLYLIFVVLVIVATYFSFKLSSADMANANQGNQMKMMTRMSTIFISIMSFSISTGIALYWIFNSSFTIFQNLVVKRRKNK